MPEAVRSVPWVRGIRRLRDLTLYAIDGRTKLGAFSLSFSALLIKTDVKLRAFVCCPLRHLSSCLSLVTNSTCLKVTSSWPTERCSVQRLERFATQSGELSIDGFHNASDLATRSALFLAKS